MIRLKPSYKNRIALINLFRGYTCLIIRIGLLFCYTIIKFYLKLPYLRVLKLF